MLHENVKFYFKVIYPIEAHYITRQIFSLAEKRSLYEFLGINYCICKRWLMGPSQLRLPPLAQTFSHATGCVATYIYCAIVIPARNWKSYRKCKKNWHFQKYQRLVKNA